MVAGRADYRGDIRLAGVADAVRRRMPVSMAVSEIAPYVWHGCYDEGWGDLIVPDAFAHPAKFSCGLIRRIFKYGFNRGWWRGGDLIGDPFAGIGTGGLMACGSALRWVGVELEPRFVELAQRCFAARRHQLDHDPVILQGDSRRFAEIVAGCDAIVTSPPYAESATDGARDNRAANLETAGINSNAWLGKRRCTQGRSDGYGSTPGQIGSLPAGKLDAVVTSPPYESNRLDGGKTQTGSYEYRAPGKGTYGRANGQLGNESGETYWQAVAQVYEQCRLALKPGGMLVVVVKDYVKGGQRVPLCDQTLELLQRIGYEPVERIRAMLVKETREAGLFGEHCRVKSRKSFFRRLAERKGSPPIDWEEVLCVRKTA